MITVDHENVLLFSIGMALLNVVNLDECMGDCAIDGRKKSAWDPFFPVVKKQWIQERTNVRASSGYVNQKEHTWRVDSVYFKPRWPLVPKWEMTHRQNRWCSDWSRIQMGLYKLAQSSSSLSDKSVQRASECSSWTMPRSQTESYTKSPLTGLGWTRTENRRENISTTIQWLGRSAQTFFDPCCGQRCNCRWSDVWSSKNQKDSRLREIGLNNQKVEKKDDFVMIGVKRKA